MTERDRADAEREIAMVMCHDGPVGARVALPWLETAIEQNPGDVPALEARGFALGQLGRGEEGLAAFRRVLDLEGEREGALTGASFVAAQAGRLEDAIAFSQRAIAISPWRAEYRAELAALQFRKRDWSAAAAACGEALRLNPANLDIRKLLVRCHIRLGDAHMARAAFETLMAFDPPGREELLRWFTPALPVESR